MQVGIAQFKSKATCDITLVPHLYFKILVEKVWIQKGQLQELNHDISLTMVHLSQQMPGLNYFTNARILLLISGVMSIGPQVEDN